MKTTPFTDIKQDESGVTFDFSKYEIKTEAMMDEKGFALNVRCHISCNILFRTTRYNGVFHFGKTPKGKNKKKKDWNAFFQCLLDNNIPVSINIIPRNGDALVMVNKLESVTYLE